MAENIETKNKKLLKVLIDSYEAHEKNLIEINKKMDNLKNEMKESYKKIQELKENLPELKVIEDLIKLEKQIKDLNINK